MAWVALAALASHFSMIGFPLPMENPAAMVASVEPYVNRCDPIPVPPDRHLCIVRDGSGAELWIGLETKDGGAAQIVTLNPAFAGEGRIGIVVQGDASPPDRKTLEPRITAELSGWEIPVALDLADPREAKAFSPGAALSVDVTAFADEIAIHADEAAYDASQKGQDPQFASNHFIPSGMFLAEGQTEPTSHAIFAGEILKSELRRNRTGKADYWWMLVRTLDNSILNVVADPADVSDPPKVGGYVAGSFWLSARLADR